MSAETPASIPVRKPRSGAFILSNLAIGHAVINWYHQGVLLVLTSVRDSASFTSVELSLLSSISGLVSNVANVPGGLAVDMAKRRWGLILTACMVAGPGSLALAAALVALTPNYLVLLVVTVLVTLPGIVWSLLAIAAISQRIPHRRAFSLSIHEFGGGVGSGLFGPLSAVALLGLGVFVWQKVALFYVAPALVLALVVGWSLRDIGTRAIAPNDPKPLGERARQMVLLLRQRTFLSLLLVIILRNAGISSLSIWVLLYLRNPIEEGGLGMSIQKAAMHLSFLSVPGVVSAPVLGYLSDRFGRKVVAVPSLVFTALLVGVMGLVGAGLLLTLLTLAVGLFPLGVMHILQATVLDHVDRGDEGASMGLITLCSAVVTVLATVLFGFILDAFGLGVVFYYSAGLVGTAAVLLLFTALRPLAAAPQPGLTVG